MLKSNIKEFMELFCLFVFLSNTLIICLNTENIAASYHSSLNGNSDFDVVKTLQCRYAKFQWALISGCYVFCMCAITTASFKKSERVVFLSLFVFHPGEEEVFDSRL